MTDEDAKMSPEADAPDLSVPESGLDMFMTSIKTEVDQSRNSREGWRNKMVRLHQLRMGIRPTKTFPWPGCSNLSWPLIDKIMRRVKPNYVGLSTNTRPTVVFQYESEAMMDAARKSEIVFDHLLWNTIPDYLTKIVSGVDQMLEKGFVVFKIHWRYQTRDVKERYRLTDLTPEERDRLENGEVVDVTPDGQPVRRPLNDDNMVGFFAAKAGLDLEDENDLDKAKKIVAAYRNGEETITFKRREVVYDCPDVVPVPAEDIMVPEEATIDVNGLRWIGQKIWMTENDLRGKQRDNGWKHIDEIIESGAASSQRLDSEKSLLVQTKEAREGLSSPIKDGFYEIWEMFCEYDIDGDGFAERVVIIYQPDTGKICLEKEFDYDHGMWPFVMIPLEITDMRWYSSRGIPEMLEDMQKNVNVQHNAKLDRMTIQNAPTFKSRFGSLKNAGNFRWIPGQHLTVMNMDDLQPIQIPVLDSSFQMEENVTRQWAEEYIGVTDFGLTNPLSNTSEPRTATEINDISQIAAATFSLDAQIWQDGMKKIYHQVWSLFNQYGPDEMWVQVLGEDKPVFVSRHEIQGKFKLVPTGNAGNANRQLAHQKAMTRLQMFNGDPLIRQDQLRKDFFDTEDYRLAGRLMKTPEELQREAAAVAAAAQKENEGPISVEEAVAAMRQIKNKKPGMKVAV